MFIYVEGLWCPGAELNHRHCDFQSHALPTELPGQKLRPGTGLGRSSALIVSWLGRVQQTWHGMEKL